MLSKRLHILMDEDKYLMMEMLAHEENLSVGELIRQTMDEKLKVAVRKQKEKREKAWKGILAWRKKFLAKNKGLTAGEILSMVREGRKYEGNS